MNLDPASSTEVNYAAVIARAGLTGTTKWHAVNRPFLGISLILVWGQNVYGQSTVPGGVTGITAIAGGAYHSLALSGDGAVVAWEWNTEGQTTVPVGALAGITAIAGGGVTALR